jgi:putative YphP/YqiW family bacilliredoxin
MYPEPMIAPMRQELTKSGVVETRTAAEVERAVKETAGTVLVIVNSVCGCAAGKMRPAVGMALRHAVVPDKSITVFAGQDREATEKARAYFVGYAPSSPSLGLLRDGQLVYMLERHQIESRDANAIAQELTEAFDTYCGRPVSARP